MHLFTYQCIAYDISYINWSHSPDWLRKYACARDQTGRARSPPFIQDFLLNIPCANLIAGATSLTFNAGRYRLFKLSAYQILSRHLFPECWQQDRCHLHLEISSFKGFRYIWPERYLGSEVHLLLLPLLLMAYREASSLHTRLTVRNYTPLSHIWLFDRHSVC